MTQPFDLETLPSESVSFIETLYASFLQDPSQVSESLRRLFRSWDLPTSSEGMPEAEAFERRSPTELLPAPPVFGKDASLLEMPATIPDPVRDTVPTKIRTPEDIKAYLRRLILFSEMTDDDLNILANITEKVRIPQGQVLGESGQTDNDLHIILQGTVQIVRDGALIGELGPGEVVGELAVLDPSPRSAAIVAATPMVLLQINQTAFEYLLRRRNTLTLALLKTLASRLRVVGDLQERINRLVRSFRERGHLMAHLDPVNRSIGLHPALTLDFHGLDRSHLEQRFTVRLGSVTTGRTLRQVLAHLQTTYCSAIGVQFMHIDNLEIQTWLRERMEDTANQLSLSREHQLRILTKLTDAVVFERFIHRKFVGAKRFSLEGTESLIPLMDQAIERAARFGVREVVIGMAHRGRLNVLANIMGKPAHWIFREFQDLDPERNIRRGDVKYHLGYSSNIRTQDGHDLHLSLCFNPSHLEFVGPVVLGRVRAKQDRFDDADRTQALPLIIHGDASFAGQGVVQELFNMEHLPGYTTGGAVHVVMNNQIGFTTPPEESRSSQYCTDVARMLQIPIFHVNGEQPEAVAQVVKLAIAFRQTFHKDVVIDMYGYRKHGHNEGDDPSFTQPVLYREISKLPSVRESYVANLLKLGEITQAEADAIARESKERLEHDLLASKKSDYQYPTRISGADIWKPYRGGPDADQPEVDTSVPEETLKNLLKQISTTPSTFVPHPKIKRFLESQAEVATHGRPADWGTGERLAMASLLAEGTPIRVSGQDSQRGTFSHRHAVLHDHETDETFTPLNHLSPTQAPLTILNSPLSETGVLGFEYGFSLDFPEGLVIWEAQFGDFCNVAQVIIDQFIASSEIKWKRLSGLCLMLPHGFEGQGPEHSSARLERFLTLSAEDNIQVVNPTTPAQLFHVLRRQVKRPLRKPLIMMTPKSLLRHPKAVSQLNDMASGGFQRVMPDPDITDPKKVKRILLTSGKVTYELLAEREKRQAHDVAILRLEQYYPFPQAQLAACLEPFTPGTPVCWVQEEPSNIGALHFLRLRCGDTVKGRGDHPMLYVSRPESASPATGSHAAHQREQAHLLERAFSET